MYPKLFDKDELKDFFATPVLRRFPSLSQFEDLFSNQNSGLSISEGTNDISILADMPGLNADEIEVTLENGILQIKGEKKEEEKDENRRYYKKSSRKFVYTIDVPVAVDESKVDAFYDKGVMHIQIPKAEHAQTKKITVRDKK